MEAHPDFHPSSQMLKLIARCDQGRIVTRFNTSGVAPVFFEVALELFGLDCVLRFDAEKAGHITIEVDQLLGFCAAFFRVSVKQGRGGLFAQNRCKLPTKIKCVGHRHVHTLSRLWTVGVAGVTCNENTGCAE